MTRLSVTLDDELIEDALKLADAKSKREVIELALKEFVRRRRIAGLIELEGSDIIDMDLDELLRWRGSTTLNS